jgi:hypothetical protein
MSSNQKNSNIDFCTIMEIKEAISSSLHLFYQTWSNIIVEADSDTRKMFKMIGGTVIAPNRAHQLADVVAWSNHNHSAMHKVKETDIVENIIYRLRKKLKI